MASVDLLADLHLITQLLLVFTVVLFTVSGLDDLLIDVYYACRQIYVALWVRPRHPRLEAAQLQTVPEQPIAILVPAWQEADVIEQMLENTVRTLDYSNYVIFVGTYPNDEPTRLAVERMRERYPNIERADCVADGPTCKADCLNWIVQRIRHRERRTGMPFQIFVMQDAEDIVHPLSLKLYNYLMPRFAMIQTPVFSLPRRLLELTAGVYIDEFAELHTKDLVVRELLGRNVPSAGVGTAFSREAVDAIAEENDNQVFRIDSLTEDYDFGFRLGSLGLKSIFVRFPIEREVERRPWWSTRTRKTKVRDWVATREYFPNRFWASVRQKTRWVIGIALQGWEHLGWRGDLRTKYVLFRDRKILLTAQVNILGYLVVALVCGFWLYDALAATPYHFSPLAGLDTWVVWLLVLNGGFFLLRLMQRFLAVTRLYGIRQGLMSAPRLLLGNVIMFLACWRALWQYGKSRWTGEKLRWDKTDHAFPSEAQLERQRRRLGDLLLERRFVTTSALTQALEVQARTGQPLGQTLIELGLAEEDEVLQVLGGQLRMAVRDVDPHAVDEALLRRLPADVAISLGVFPIGEEAGVLQVATDRLISRSEVDQIERAAGGPVEICLASRRDIAFAMRRRYRNASGEIDLGMPKVGERLVLAGVLTADELDGALRLQRGMFKRVGDVVVERGWVERDRVEEAAAVARAESRPIGEELIRRGWITSEQLDEALTRQAETDRRLGDVLIREKLVSREELDDVLDSVARRP